MVGFEFRESAVKRLLKFCFTHRLTGPAPSIRVRDGIGFHCRTALVRIAGTIVTDLFANILLIRLGLIASLAFLFSRSIANRKHVVHACIATGPGYTTSYYTRLTLAICGNLMDCCTPKIHLQPL
ncbi:hypothetical protein TNCV_1517931 [Trichonephila clavipes]|nr:hypothetical protein TNCV_1517931 [Trichonephila clavipes]